MSKNLAKAFGGAAAMISLAGLASAQVGSVRRDTVRRDTTIRRDTTTAMRLIVLPGRMDSILIIAGRVMREDYGSPAWIKATAALDSLIEVPLPPQFSHKPVRFMVRAFQGGQGWVGLNTQGPAAQAAIDSTGARRVRYFGYQDILSVDPGSPAEHAGILPGDVLVAYNGVDLINHEFNLRDLFAPKKRVDLTVKRRGDVKQYSLIVAATPEPIARRRVEMERQMWFDGPASGTIVISSDSGGPMRLRSVLPSGRGAGAVGSIGMTKMMFFAPNGLFGAGLATVNEELSKVRNLPKGVLVTNAPEDSPAFRSGLRIGDVIVMADDDSVETFGDLRDLVIRRLADHSIALQVVRQQKAKKLTLSWNSP